MEKIGYAVLGCGNIGKLHAGVIVRLPKGRLVAVCDSNRASADALGTLYGCKVYYDMEAMLGDGEVDVVSVCLPSGAHREAVLACAARKKNVLCEKPIDISAPNAREMVEACDAAGVCFGVILQHRFDSAAMALHRAVDEGLMGKLLWGASRTIWYRDEEYFANPWRGTWQFDGGGALINQSIHYIDLLLSFFGPVKSVSGKCRTLCHHQIETEDVGVANLEFANGCIGTVEGSTACYPGLYAELCLFGEKGSAIIRNDHLLFYQLESGRCAALDAVMDVEKANTQHTGPAIPDDSHYRQYEDYTDALLEGRQPKVTGADALHGIEVIKAIYTSSQRKEEVYL